MEKTLAMKILEGKSIEYQAFPYPADERDAIVVADHIGADPQTVYKTLVVNRHHRKPLLVLVAANRRLDLKKLARVTGDKKLKMASHTEAESITGLQVGGITPLALLNKGFIVYIDRAAEALPNIFISAGQKGMNLRVPLDKLVKLVQARFADVSK